MSIIIIKNINNDINNNINIFIIVITNNILNNIISVTCDFRSDKLFIDL